MEDQIFCSVKSKPIKTRYNKTVSDLLGKQCVPHKQAYGILKKKRKKRNKSRRLMDDVISFINEKTNKRSMLDNYNSTKLICEAVELFGNKIGDGGFRDRALAAMFTAIYVQACNEDIDEFSPYSKMGCLLLKIFKAGQLCGIKKKE